MRKSLIIAGVLVVLFSIGVFILVEIVQPSHASLPDDTNSQKLASVVLSNSSSTSESASTSSEVSASSTSFLATPYIVIGTAKLYIGVADTEASREQGLSGRASLASDEGLFFVMDAPTIEGSGIWMKDMNFPIDVIWFDKDLRVVTIVPDMKPDSYPSVYTPTSPAQFVLEVNAGLVAREGIKIGQVAKIVKEEEKSLPH